jgi:ABC-type dipeptide/oligopeptide/nickel transport system ATPase component
VLLITHDFGVVAELCSRAMVMRAGKIVEDAPVDEIFHSPKHEYTAELLRAVPRLSADR